MVHFMPSRLKSALQLRFLPTVGAAGGAGTRGERRKGGAGDEASGEAGNAIEDDGEKAKEEFAPAPAANEAVYVPKPTSVGSGSGDDEAGPAAAADACPSPIMRLPARPRDERRERSAGRERAKSLSIWANAPVRNLSRDGERFMVVLGAHLNGLYSGHSQRPFIDFL
jgi:hypothetical protein